MLPRRAEQEPVNIIGVDRTEGPANAAAEFLGLFFDRWGASVDALVRSFVVDDDVADSAIETVFWRAWKAGVADLQTTEAVSAKLRLLASKVIAEALAMHPSARRTFARSNPRPT